MPITEELKNIKKFEAVGFTHEQAEVLAEIQEDTALKGIESLKEFISDKLDIQSKDIQQQFKDLRNIDLANIHAEIRGLDTKLSNEIKNLDSKLDSELKLVRMEFKADIEKSLKDLLIKIFAIVFGVSGVLFTALKLFG